MNCEQRTPISYMGEIRNSESLKKPIEINGSRFVNHLRFHDRQSGDFSYFLWNESAKFWHCSYDPVTTKFQCKHLITPKILKIYPTVVWAWVWKCAPDLRYRVITDVGYALEKP